MFVASQVHGDTDVSDNEFAHSVPSCDLFRIYTQPIQGIFANPPVYAPYPSRFSLPFPLQLMFRVLLQTVSGLRLTDTFLNRTYEHDEIAQVFVYNVDSEATIT